MSGHSHPAGQMVHSDWLPSEYVPDGQSISISWVVTGQDLPAGHALHTDWAPRLYVPSSQATAVDLSVYGHSYLGNKRYNSVLRFSHDTAIGICIHLLLTTECLIWKKLLWKKTACFEDPGCEVPAATQLVFHYMTKQVVKIDKTGQLLLEHVLLLAGLKCWLVTVRLQ